MINIFIIIIVIQNDRQNSKNFFLYQISLLIYSDFFPLHFWKI